MAVLPTDRSIAPPFWAVDPRRLGALGRLLWPRVRVGFVPSIEWGLNDIKGSPLRLSLNGTATLERSGLVCDATGEGAEAPLPEYLKLSFPMTLVWYGYRLGTQDANSQIFALTHNNTDTSPWASAAIGVNASSLPCLNWNDPSFRQASLSGAADLVPQLLVGSVTIQSGTGTTDVFGSIKKNLSASAGQTGATLGAPTYGASALIALGNYTGISRNSNCVTMAAYLLNDSGPDIAELMTDPFALVRPEARKLFGYSRTGGGGGVGSTARSFVAGMIG